MDNSIKKNKEVAAVDTAAETVPEKRGPIKTFRIDDVSVSVWTRKHQYKGRLTTFYSFSFERSYKDAAGQYRYTKTFGQDDLGKVIQLCQQANEFVVDLQRQATSDQTEKEAA